jgi:hypothetical protein
MISAVRAVFDKALNKDGYKDNAFHCLINSGTPPLDSLNILLASHLVTEEEKNKAFRPWKSTLLQVHQADASAMNTFELLTLMMKCPTWCEVFEDDIRSRGGYVPPMTLQTIGKDGTVKETHTINRDGTAQVTKGGRLGEVPGAPEDFNEAQSKLLRTSVDNKTSEVSE